MVHVLLDIHASNGQQHPVQSLCSQIAHLQMLFDACATGKYRHGSALSLALPLGAAYGKMP